MSYELFETEQETVAEARARLEAAGKDGSVEAADFAALLRDYEKLLRTTRRLMRLSDRNERELGLLAEKHRLAAEEIARKNAELETLSLKLSKYLSPQLYETIFTGKQEVRIASRRKKLTVFFSDIEGFTHITESMESEDLTQLVNHYLTEMTRVALAHGATIDKYVGDSIVIFFGDPVSNGVKEDAVACVRMAIAMQRRMAELQEDWRNAGIERPLKCRIGISTGYCTVGNFGSEDRMDYTIIGSGVNLASRLEAAAPPGSILVSYETYAHVRDVVHCRPRGEVRLRGIADPVAVFEAVDLHERLEAAERVIREDAPGLKLELDLERLAGEDRAAAVERLERALLRLKEGDAPGTAVADAGAGPAPLGRRAG